MQKNLRYKLIPPGDTIHKKSYNPSEPEVQLATPKQKWQSQMLLSINDYVYTKNLMYRQNHREVIRKSIFWTLPCFNFHNDSQNSNKL